MVNATMKTTLISTAFATAIALLGSCANRTKPAPPQSAPPRVIAATVSHPENCPHCGRCISYPPVTNPIYGPAAYEDRTQTVPAPASAVPTAAAAPVVPATTAPPPQLTVDADGSKHYVVASGDSLWKIAKAYSVSIDAIKSANALENDIVQVGQKLEIPAE